MIAVVATAVKHWEEDEEVQGGWAEQRTAEIVLL